MKQHKSCRNKDEENTKFGPDFIGGRIGTRRAFTKFHRLLSLKGFICNSKECEKIVPLEKFDFWVWNFDF